MGQGRGFALLAVGAGLFMAPHVYVYADGGAVVAREQHGGLLVTVDADTAEEMVGRMREQGYPQADIVGELVEVAAPPPSTSPDVCVAGPKLIRIAV